VLFVSFSFHHLLFVVVLILHWYLHAVHHCHTYTPSVLFLPPRLFTARYLGIWILLCLPGTFRNHLQFCSVISIVASSLYCFHSSLSLMRPLLPLRPIDYNLWYSLFNFIYEYCYRILYLCWKWHGLYTAMICLLSHIVCSCSLKPHCQFILPQLKGFWNECYWNGNSGPWRNCMSLNCHIEDKKIIPSSGHLMVS